MNRFILKILIILSCLATANLAYAQMGSGNFKIIADSFNEAGTETSSSANYKIADTAGEQGTGISSSANFQLFAGFRHFEEEDPTLSWSISSNAESLSPNPLTTTALSSASYTITTSTNANNGYITTIVEDGDFRTNQGGDINDVSDGAVTIGVEEYGISTSGADGQFNGIDTAVTSTPKIIASSNIGVMNSTVTVTHKAAIDNLTPSGNYQHIVTYITTGRY